MSSCEKFRFLLPLSAGGDLDAAEAGQVGAHVAECRSCRLEAAELSESIALARAQTIVEYGLPDEVRRRVALESARNASRTTWVFMPPVFLTVRPSLLATAAACLLALVALPLALRERPAPSAPKEIARIEVVHEGGEVRLAWSDGTRASYTVYKSHDPREISRGEAHVVRGNVWTDSQADSSPIVFYAVE